MQARTKSSERKFCLIPPSKILLLNDLALKEWQRRIDDAIEEDLAGDIDEYYASKTVNWDTTISILTDAVKDLMRRGQAKDAAILIEEAEDKTIDVSSVEHEEGEYCEIDVEYNCSPEDFNKLRYLARSGVRKQGRSFSKIAERKRQKAISKMFG